MKKNLFAVIPLILFVMACTTTNTRIARNGESEILITRVDNEADDYIDLGRISIDGESKGSIKRDGKMHLVVSNGKHTIEAYRNMVVIEPNDDRYKFTLDDGRLSNGKQTKLPEFKQDAPKVALKISDDALAKAIDKSFNIISPLLKDGSKIAVVSIATSSAYHGEFVIEELSMRLVNAQKFTVFDRKTLDAIRTEQNFQMTGEVDDDIIIGIGKFVGAEIVITGSIDVSGSSTRLRIKALDVKTAQVVAMSSERIR
ncbi:MAG: CsgG/HfaB family protein [Treponema sp.]|nr:CsgG/HfaB family protein [Treponema sp.]